MLGRGALTRTVVAQIVHVDSVDDVLVAALAAHGFQAGEEFVLAVEAAVGTVLRVSGIVEFVRLHVLMHDAEALHESFGVALVRFRKRGGVRGDSHGVPSEGAIGRPRQIGGVGAAGEGHDYAAHGGEIGQQLLLLLLDGAGCDEVRQSGHKSGRGQAGGLAYLVYCNGSRSASSAGGSSASGRTLAAATLSPSSRFTRRTPCVERPACRMVDDSMRMILPFWLTIMTSESSFTRRMPTTRPVLWVVFMLMTPLPPREIRR